MPDITGRVNPRGAVARRALAKAYGSCARPLGLRALKRMLERGLPAQLEPALRVLVGGAPPPQASVLAERLERRRAELRDRPEVYRYAYDPRAPRMVRWPDEAAEADGEEVSLGWFASAGSVPERWGLCLHLCAGALGAQTVVELGAGTGLSGAYLAAAPSVESFVTLEGSPPLARVAAETLALVTDRATVVEGAFDIGLPRTLAGLRDAGRCVDLAYLDGHHDEVATLGYLEALRPHLRRGSIVVLDDIRLWHGMWQAWCRARSSTAVSAAVDTGRFGILAYDDAVRHAAHFELSRYTGRWRVGPPRPAGAASGAVSGEDGRGS